MLHLHRGSFSPALFLAIALTLAFAPACGTAKAQGATMGLGIGSLIGGLAGDREGALIGAGIGAGVGFLIGDAEDRRRAGELTEAPAEDLQPLAGTQWRLQRLETDEVHDVSDLVATFSNDGTVSTVMTTTDGRQETAIERYRIVDGTLIVNRDDYVINIPFTVVNNRLDVESEDGSWSASLSRLR
jgi:Glycine zipper